MKVNVISLPYNFQVLYVLCFTRPRYQVSVYRTTGPLVRNCVGNKDGFLKMHAITDNHTSKNSNRSPRNFNYWKDSAFIDPLGALCLMLHLNVTLP